MPIIDVNTVNLDIAVEPIKEITCLYSKVFIGVFLASYAFYHYLCIVYRMSDNRNKKTTNR